ncbi:MAG: hypothetical protein ACTSRW_13755 [Candidatus Helarchaeota archaeon]
MGCNLEPLLNIHERDFDDIARSRIAVDGTNLIFKYLTKIRKQDRMLKDKEGRPVSHLFGIFYFIINSLENHVQPIMVFDGMPIREKRVTPSWKIERLVNTWKWHYFYTTKENVKKGRELFKDLSFTFNYIIVETIELLKTMGIAVCRAPSDAEAQCARLVIEKKARATLSQDHDSLLFGSHYMIREFNFNTNTFKYYGLKETLKRHEITQEQLIDIALLIGTDFNPGIKGIGPKKGLKAIQTHGTIENFLAAKRLEIEWNPARIRNYFLHPITMKFTPLFHHPNLNAVAHFIGKRFSKSRLENGLKRLRKAAKNFHVVQTSISRFV